MSSDDDRRIGLILIHGIGGQQAGDTTERFVKAFSALVPSDFCESPPCLMVGGREVRIYEGYWAAELEGEAVRTSFNYYDPQIIAWFPSLNRRGGLFHPPGYSRGAVLAWTGALAVAAFGAVLMLPLFPVMDEVLDNRAADVTNYVKSAGGQLGDDNKLHHAAHRVVGRVHSQLLAAASDGCSEIHIVAHSLGTMVVYHALSGFTLPQDEPIPEDLRHAVSLVSRLYTIGSPLEKIRFIWPKLISTGYLGQPASSESASRADDPVHGRRVQVLSWFNFYDHLDPVSSRLRRFDCWGGVENRRVGGGAGFLAAHSAYFRHPAFVSHVSEGFTGEVPEFSRLTLWLRLKLTARSLAQSAILIFLFLWMLTLVASLALFILSILWAMLTGTDYLGMLDAPAGPLIHYLIRVAAIGISASLLLVVVNLAVVWPIFGRRPTRKVNDILTVPLILSFYLLILGLGIAVVSAVFAQHMPGRVTFGVFILLVLIALPIVLGRRTARSIHRRWWS